MTIRIRNTAAEYSSEIIGAWLGGAIQCGTQAVGRSWQSVVRVDVGGEWLTVPVEIIGDELVIG